MGAFFAPGVRKRWRAIPRSGGYIWGSPLHYETTVPIDSCGCGGVRPAIFLRCQGWHAHDRLFGRGARAEYQCLHHHESIYCGRHRGGAAALRTRRGGRYSLPTLSLQREQWRQQPHLEHYQHRHYRRRVGVPDSRQIPLQGENHHPVRGWGRGGEQARRSDAEGENVVATVSHTTTTSSPAELANSTTRG